MKLHIVLSSMATLLLMVTSARADVVNLKNGSTVDGVIKKVAAGQVVIDVGAKTETIDVGEVESMDFTTPHLVVATDRVPIEHFLKDIEAQEIVRNMQNIEKAASEIEALLRQVRADWLPRQPIPAELEGSWDAERETFRKPLALYQELLNDLYFHVLAKVDRYNLLMNAASDVYVGVKGPFNAGSSLVSKDMRELPLTRYVPRAWYNTIHKNGYVVGYNEASRKCTSPPYLDNRYPDYR